MRGRPDSLEPWWAPGMDTGFRQRCASALTHPATVVALATLLLNDLLFKAMWPDAWVTGKLSDLAWVALALPLLAFLLSLFTRGNVIAARAAFLTSYVGLPLLYAAFNTFEPVHHWILRGISIASGGMGQTPLDVTDSIVIPLGWAVAVWVWRRPLHSPDALRLRWALLIAGVAALASIATSYPDPDHGISGLGVVDTEEGSVVAARGSYILSRSDDGGVSWEPGLDPEIDRNTIVWGVGSVETPRGNYSIEGREIVLAGDEGSTEVVYSTGYLAKWGNLWTQAQQTTRLETRVLETQPRAIIYDERSGNLIVALGIQGVLVGTPDGQWMPYAVGPYTPTDFSFSSKTRLLLSNVGFWAAALALSLSMTGLGLLILRVTTSDSAGCGAFALVIISVLSSAFLIFNSGGPQGKFIDAYPEPISVLGPFVIGIIAYSLAFASILVLWEKLRSWHIILGGFAAMNVLVFLAFMLWLHLGIVLVTAQFLSIALTALAAFLMSGYLKRKTL